MRIIFCCPGMKAQPWLKGIDAAMGEACAEEWVPGAPQADYAVVWSPPQQMVDEQSGLKGMFNMGAGVDALMTLRLPPGMLVVRLSDAGMGVQMAEYVCQAVIRHFRELGQYESDMAAGQWDRRRPPVRAEFTVGVLGLGVLGERVARALQTFEFPVRGWSRTRRDLPGVQCFAGDGELEPFLRASRVLVCLLPLTPQTEGILDAHRLSMLRPGGYLINVARGAHVVDEDLLALLDSGHLAGAALDVFRTEPLPAGHPFWGHPKLTLTPHISAATLREETLAQIAGKIRALQRGESLAGVVDLQRGY